MIPPKTTKKTQILISRRVCFECGQWIELSSTNLTQPSGLQEVPAILSDSRRYQFVPDWLILR